MGVSVLGFIPLGDKPSLFSETSMWKFTAEQLGQDIALEAGIPKARPEFLVTGNAYSPDGEPKQGLSVKVELGNKEKTLSVFGDRYWDGESPSKIKPFTEMPLNWQHAFGGHQFEENPLGKGFSPVEEQGAKVQWMPNIQSQKHQVVSLDSTPEPVSFSPVDFMWPQRMSLQGTYDEEWQEKYYPGFPPDIDWGYFNVASKDQQYDDMLEGDENYSLENMHPQDALIEGQLPNIKACCFVTQKIEDIEVFEEIKTHLRTVWFFPNSKRAVLVYQGSVEVQEEDAADILHLLISAENQGEPRSLDHYKKVLLQRLDKKKGGLYSLKDSDLLPKNLNTIDSDIELATKQLEPVGFQEKNFRRKTEIEHESIKETLRAQNLDVEKYKPKPLPKKERKPSLEELPSFFEKKEKEAEKQRKKLDKLKPTQEKELRSLCEEQDLDYEEVQATIKKSDWDVPKLIAVDTLNDFMCKRDALRSEGKSEEQIKQQIGEISSYQEYVEKERKIVDLYRMSAHHRGKPPALSNEESLSKREKLASLLKSKKGVLEEDFLGVDLSGRNLNGFDLQGIYLAGANLDGADLRGANLTGAVLAYASLKGTYLEGAILEKTNLGKTDLKKAKFQSCLITKDLILAGANLEGADLSYTKLEGVDCFETKFSRANLNHVTANNMTFLESDLSKCSFKKAQLNGCNFIQVDVTEANFSESELYSTTFLMSKGVNANFWKAKMENLRFVDKCDFSSANFSFGLLNKANFRGTILNRCNFESTEMNGSDFSECDLQGAMLDRSIAVGGLFTKTNFSGASMRVMDLMAAILMWSNFSGADLTKANLYQADLARVLVDNETRLKGANIGKARLIPKHLDLKSSDLFERLL